MFHPIRPSETRTARKSTIAARQLLQAIQSGRIGLGEGFPSERLIASTMGVSRGVIREALSALQISGIVQIRVGEGAFVSSVPSSERQRHGVLSLLEGNEGPLEIWESRREIEALVACLAVVVATDDDVAWIGEALDRMRAAADALDLEAYLTANSEFHRMLAAPAENSILRSLAFDLIGRTDQLTVKAPADRYVRAHVERSIEKHVDIFVQYRRREPAPLRDSIHRHFNELEAAFLED